MWNVEAWAFEKPFRCRIPHAQIWRVLQVLHTVSVHFISWNNKGSLESLLRKDMLDRLQTLLHFLFWWFLKGFAFTFANLSSVPIIQVVGDLWLTSKYAVSYACPRSALHLLLRLATASNATVAAGQKALFSGLWFRNIPESLRRPASRVIFCDGFSIVSLVRSVYNFFCLKIVWFLVSSHFVHYRIEAEHINRSWSTALQLQISHCVELCLQLIAVKHTDTRILRPDHRR